MSGLGEYIDDMRKRHRLGQRILSKSQMAREAGLNINAVQQLIAGKMGASPTTLKALADVWGTDEDYPELMRLAGHPVAERVAYELGPEAQELVGLFEQLSPDDRRRMLGIARALLELSRPETSNPQTTDSQAGR